MTKIKDTNYNEEKERKKEKNYDQNAAAAVMGMKFGGWLAIELVLYVSTITKTIDLFPSHF